MVLAVNSASSWEMTDLRIPLASADSARSWTWHSLSRAPNRNTASSTVLPTYEKRKISSHLQEITYEDITYASIIRDFAKYTLSTWVRGHLLCSYLPVLPELLRQNFDKPQDYHGINTSPE